MAYNNYQFVADTTFNPLTLQEMMVPFTYYKEAYDKYEDTLADLSDKSDKFKYLSEELPEGSKAREIYEGYSNDLANAARDLWTKGLNAGNSTAFRSLRRRYSGEIGELERADEALKKEQDLRREMSLKDPSMLWAINSNDLNIDNFIGGRNKLNMYGVSGKDLYSQAVQASKTASSRKSSFGEAGSAIDDYYRVLVQENGYNAESVAAFKESMDTIPELRDAVDGILLRNGVGENLSGADLEKARRWVIDGITDGMMYEAKYNPVQNPGKLTAAQAGELELGRARLAEEARHHQAEESNASTALRLQQNKDAREARGFEAEFTSQFEAVPEKDSSGNIKRDSKGNIIYKKDNNGYIIYKERPEYVENRRRGKGGSGASQKAPVDRIKSGMAENLRHQGIVFDDVRIVRNNNNMKITKETGTKLGDKQSVAVVGKDEMAKMDPDTYNFIHAIATERVGPDDDFIVIRYSTNGNTIYKIGTYKP